MPIAAGPSCKQKQKTLINYAMLRYDLGETIILLKKCIKTLNTKWCFAC